MKGNNFLAGLSNKRNSTADDDEITENKSYKKSTEIKRNDREDNHLLKKVIIWNTETDYNNDKKKSTADEKSDYENVKKNSLADEKTDEKNSVALAEAIVCLLTTSFSL